MIWTTIFTLCAFSAWLAWRSADTPALRWRVVLLFGVNAVLNVLWSALYFALQRPDWAFAEVIVLWLSILAMIVFCGRFSRSAAWLLVPYLVWVSFAAALNWAVVQLNAPFG